jgi:hypothetical protein
MGSREPAGLPRFGAILASSLLLLALGACGGDGSGFQLPPTTGTLQVTTTTAGEEPDTDGYTLQLDGEAPQPIGAAATMERSELEPGDHTIRLDGLAPNCSVAENPRTIRIDAGQTTTSTFAVACSATSGGIVITTVTTGVTPDPDGFGVVLDGVDQGPIAANGQLSLTGLALGSHVVGLSGLAGNCSLQGDNLRAVTVTPGSSAPVDYAITCTAPPANAGTLQVITVTTGDSPDLDGYSFSLDRGDNQPIGANATATIPNLAAGAHRVQLSGLSDNCRVQGDNPRTVSVPSGGTKDVTFNVSCTRPVGSIRVTVATTGSPADPNGYQVTLDGGTGQHVDADGSVRITDVPAGSHAVALGDIATNCNVTGGPTREVTVTTGATAEVRFAVICSDTGGGSGSILVTTETSGSDLDPDGYSVLINGDALGSVPATGQQTIQGLAPGSYIVQLDGVAGNCHIAGNNARGVTVVDGQSSPVNYSITCDALPPETGSIHITTNTNGAEPDDDGYDVAVDGSPSQHVTSNGEVTINNLIAGEHQVQLSGVAGNCTVENNPRTVQVSAGSTTEVAFAIQCAATTGSIEVSVTTSGDQPDDDGYVVRLDGGSPKAIDASEPETFPDVPPGNHEVSLSNVAANCTVDGGPSQTASVVAGETNHINFAVTCSPLQSQTGSLQIHTTTDGDDPDGDGYDVAVDDGVGRHIGSSDAITIEDVSPGNHTVRLSGIAGNCSVDANPKSIDVVAGAMNDLSFAVSCAAQSGSIAVSVSTVGEELDPNGYVLTLDGAATGRAIGINASETFADLRTGNHDLELGDVAPNCNSVDLHRTAAVAANETSSVNFDLTCVATGP